MHRLRTVASAWAIAALLAATLASGANATFPGSNGRIGLSNGTELATVAADGSDLKFCPTAVMTRGQMAALLHRALD